MTSSTNHESSNSENDESFKTERRDRKKHRRITNKKDKTPEDIRKLKVLSAKLAYYDNINKLRKTKTEPTHEKETDDEFLHKAYNENNGYWEKEYERRKIEAEERKRQEEAEQQKRQEERKRQKEAEQQKRQEEAEERKRQEEAENKFKGQYKHVKQLHHNTVRTIINEIINMSKTIPEDILEFLGETYNGKKRRVIYKKYHPDKNKSEDKTLYEAYCKLIGSHKDTPCKSTGLH
jgi:hypothetical protein